MERERERDGDVVHHPDFSVYTGSGEVPNRADHLLSGEEAESEAAPGTHNRSGDRKIPIAAPVFLGAGNCPPEFPG